MILIISGPSGCGKTTIVQNLSQRLPSSRRVITYTTRLPRAREHHGEHYNFVNRAQFWGMCSRGEFIEHAEVHGQLYGTARADITPRTADEIVILIIDVQGAALVRAQCDNVKSVFILPPDIEALESRLASRNTDSDGVRALRLKNAIHEIEIGKSTYDIVVTNDDLDRCVSEIEERLQK